AWASPTKKQCYVIARLGKQTFDYVGKAHATHATIRSRHRNALPAAALVLPIRESRLFSLDSLYAPHKNLKRSSETHKHMVSDDL
ncbi:hypothetical protein, partial [Neisseria mucosa]|uniref:hypothetical protein n=1 Tax=Neisseria mucosa TaxID=488 RepID=UPI0027DF199F